MERMVKKVLMMLLGGGLVAGLSLPAPAVSSVELHEITASDAALGDDFDSASAAIANPITSANGYDDSGNHLYTISATSETSVSIVGAGINRSGAIGDDGEVDVSIGFTFNLMGVNYTAVQVNGNGHIYMGTGYNPANNYQNGGNSNSAHPEGNSGSIHTNYNGPVIAFRWDDWNVNDSDTQGGLYTHTRGTAPDREFVVEYDRVAPYQGSNIISTFQLILREGSNEIVMIYDTQNEGRFGSAIGIQLNDTTYLQYGWFPTPGSTGFPVGGDALIFSRIAGPFLGVDTGDLVFPTQSPDSTAPAGLQLTLENIGTGSLQFQASIINDTLGEFSVSPTSPQTLAEGASTDLNINWDPAAAPLGLHTAQLSISHDTAQPSPVVIELIGKVKAIGGKHVLVVGVDGCRSDALQVADTPNMDALIADGAVTYNAFAGGILGTPAQQATSSGPGWSSILCGVWVDKHNVPIKSFSNPNYGQYPHFFTRIKENDPSMYLASIVQWSPINTYIVPDDDTDFESSGSGASVASQAAALLATEDPDVLFLHFDDVDGAGHSYGYSPASSGYLADIEGFDTHIGTVVTAIQNRPNYPLEDWLIVVTSDHGGSGTGHGGQTAGERTIFIIAGGNAACLETVSPGPGMTAIPPTVMHHLGIPVAPAWGWEDGPFGLTGCEPVCLNPPAADITGPDSQPDCFVDLIDLSLLTAQYLDDTVQNPEADLSGPAGTPDGTVDLYDLAFFASQFLDCNLKPNTACP